jgi:hypothetical protein
VTVVTPATSIVAGALFGARVRHIASGERQGDQVDRKVDEEHPAPRKRLCEQTAEHEPDRAAARRDRAPEPSAVVRSQPSANVVLTIESAAGETSAAPRPWAARPKINTPLRWQIRSRARRS